MTPLNHTQKRSILSTFLDMHRRMAEIETMLVQADSSSPFVQYANDLLPGETAAVRDCFAAFRAEMVACLSECDIPLEPRRTSVRWSLQTCLTFFDLAITEFSPKRLRSYGATDPSAAAKVTRAQQRLRRLVERLAACPRQGSSPSVPPPRP